MEFKKLQKAYNTLLARSEKLDDHVAYINYRAGVLDFYSMIQDMRSEEISKMNDEAEILLRR